MIFKTLENNYSFLKKIEIEYDVKMKCKIGKQYDDITIKIIYFPKDKIIEFLSFKKFLKDSALLFETIYEALGNRLYEVIEDHIKPNYLRIEIYDKEGMRIKEVFEK